MDNQNIVKWREKEESTIGKSEMNIRGKDNGSGKRKKPNKKGGGGGLEVSCGVHSEEKVESLRRIRVRGFNHGDYILLDGG